MTADSNGNIRRYAVVGTSARASMYVGALAGVHARDGVIVAWCDPNGVRMSYYDEVLAAAGLPAPARYQPGEFNALLAKERPERRHRDIAGLYASPVHRGCTGRRVRRDPGEAGRRRRGRRAAALGRGERRGGYRAGELIVTFNYRYSPRNSALRQVIADGTIGNVTSVHFEWVLDTVHGADYFRRWHREKSASGGLLVHKASHHFNLVNWWTGDTPVSVYARGALRFYGDVNAKERGLGDRPERSHGAPGMAGDPFALDLAADDRLRRLYLEAEKEDGYLRDRDVFSPGITIEDNAAVLVTYESGAFLTYSLNAHSPWEGYRVSVNGDAGRAELEVVERGHVRSVSDGGINGRPAVDPMMPGENPETGNDVRPVSERLVVQRHWEPAYTVPIVRGPGGHGGGDARLLNAVFRRDGAPDPLGQQAGYIDGLRSVLTGLAANRSIATGRVVNVSEFGIPLTRGATAL